MNNYKIYENCCIIELTQGKMTVIDVDDIETVSQYQWHAHCSKGGYWYAWSYIKINDKRKRIALHRFLLKEFDSKIYIDHINHNTLDNRKTNLRRALPKENIRNQKLAKHNTSGYKGVTWAKREEKWMSKIQVNGKTKFIGYFDNLEEAHDAYCKAAIVHHGEFANFGDKI